MSDIVNARRMDKAKLRKISNYIWEIPMSTKPGMKVPARIFASEKLLSAMDEGVFEQITNVAQLPGLVGTALAMPDAHWGYGAPIGAVFATDPKAGGVISPGAVGFDINCGMRLITTNLTQKEVAPKIEKLVDSLFENIPAGVGGKGFVRLSDSEFKKLMVEGAAWVIKRGFGWKEDLGSIEEGGKIEGANPDKVSQKALERGRAQLGTLGSGNHYLEVQIVGKIFDQNQAKHFGLEVGQVAVMIHCGSRGFGHQVATDYLTLFEERMGKYGIAVPDPQLSAAPFESQEGKDYFSAMAAAANNAFANRQLITHRVREVFEEIFGTSAEKLGMKLIYDVAHNIAKREEHTANGKPLTVIVHRKGATRSFPRQPVIIGGSMESGSYLLVGTEDALKLSFGSTAHGSGRTMSRAAAKRQVRGEKLQQELKNRGIYIRTTSMPGLAEEAGLAYKNISEVVETISQLNLSKPVASFAPIGNIKG